MASTSITIDDLINAPEAHLRAILISLCDDRHQRRLVLSRLADLMAYDTPTTALKRKAISDVFICVQCNSPFSYEDNVDGNCRYHPDTIYRDDESDVWCDVYDDAEIPDDEDGREDHPEGYRYLCCEQVSDEPGCKVGRHEAHPDRAKAPKTETPKALDETKDSHDDDKAPSGE